MTDIGLLLLVNGDPLEDGRKMELIPLGLWNEKCNSPGTFPDKLYGAMGVKLQNGGAILCGGRNMDDNENTKKCWIIGEEEPAVIMTAGRRYPALLLMGDSTVWVTGGFNGQTAESSTEYVSFSSRTTTPGPNLPDLVERHCLIQINSSTVILYGGRHKNYSETITLVESCRFLF